MASRYRMTRRVAFSETDAAGIVHFSVFFRYMEDAEHAFLRSIGLSVHRHGDDRIEGFPRVAASCEYRRPLAFEQEFAADLYVSAIGRKSVTYTTFFTRLGEAEPLARGSVTAVYVVRASRGEPMRAEPIPAPIAGLIEVDPDIPDWSIRP